jgi:phage shock protein E
VWGWFLPAPRLLSQKVPTKSERKSIVVKNSLLPKLFQAIALFGLALVTTIVFGFVSTEAAATDVSRPTIIDVRTTEEFAAGHLSGAINLPLNAIDFHERLNSISQDGDFVVHCGTGARADRVVAFMTQQGFSGRIKAHSLEEALDLTNSAIVGDLSLANRLNPTTQEHLEIAGEQPTCSITGAPLLGLTRD